MSLMVIPNDVHVNGQFSADSMTLAAASVSNDTVLSTAAIAASKQRHYHQFWHAEPQASTAAAVTVGFRPLRAGTINKVRLGALVGMSTGGSDDKTVTIVVKKNGVTIGLTGNTLNKTHTSLYIDCTVPATSYAAGDLITIEITVGGSTGTQAAGLYFCVECDEAGI